MTSIAKVDLPRWTTPDSLGAAMSAIESLGRSLTEHAYLIGRHLAWVKGTVGHGRFQDWIKEHVWFSVDTAQRMMAFAGRCDGAGQLEEYAPGKNRTMRLLESGKVSELVVDVQFARIWPECSEEENAAFEQSIITFGCLVPIQVWKGSNIILDGHRRYVVCKEHDIPLEVDERDLPDRYAALDFILSSNLCRRQLTEDQRAAIMVELRELRKKEA